MGLNINGTTGISGVDGSASAPALQGTDSNTGINFGSDTVNINTGGSTRATVDSLGRLGIGTSSLGSYNANADNLVIVDSGHSGISVQSGASSNGVLAFTDGANTSWQGFVEYEHTGNNLKFGTNGDERMRVDSSGRLFAGRTNNISVGGNASDHCFEQKTNDGYTLTIHADQTNQRGLGMFYTNGKTPEAFMFCEVSGSNRLIILGSGNVINANNSYGQISDISLKENIVDANSQWDDIKNLKIRNFNFKSSTGYDTHTQIGLVAQEVETVSPKLVDTDEDGIKRVTSSVLYMKAVKCLQEAIAKIEVLETKVAALEEAQTRIETLETKVAALEAG